ncbi:BREX-1 system adenine-specific DNA-methyltransferase PglX [Dehalobacter sp. DCM]|uniref:BREX-1 system adenine-specific DNA-methyltransferase PglX n=1 Tax=Dehalobacter sp. DCM TaxID=2907827 RepID=UPI0030818401|nr:BREX-1 system adenine-specific DNA-methyltransferase PglX [Dehalobacter sp. DCM]
MNKNAIQKYAVWARNELIEQVKQRAYQYGINDKGYGDGNAAVIAGRVLSADEKRQRAAFVAQIKDHGYQQAVEEVAYIWFNRFVALRFMEVNDYLPTHVRVFSDASGGFSPEILKDVLHLDLDGLDKSKVSELIHDNKTDELYRYLLLTQCNSLNEALPEMFEKLGSYTEMLLPNNILKLDGVLGRLVTDIPEEDFHDAVQIIGWLYQYYNTEPKQEVFDGLKKNVKITKENIPAATQLFTPDWIVRYMVENSLGRLWLESHPNSRLRECWKYYLDEAEQTPEVAERLRILRTENAVKSPEDIKVIDPCMGSGHILVYTFDVLMQIYTSEGYSERDAAKLILEKNLYGLDIDRRAYQLAYFSLMMKARQYNRRILTVGVRPQVYEPTGYAYGMEYGSLVRVDKLEPMPELSKGQQMMLFDDSYETKLNVWNFRRLLAQKYDVVVTNPPYRGSSDVAAMLANFLKNEYPNSKSDLFAAFIERCEVFTKHNGYCSMVTMQSWMFLSSYEILRKRIIGINTISSLVHIGYNSFPDINSKVAQAVAFTIFNNGIQEYYGKYLDLTSKYPQAFDKESAYFHEIEHPYIVCEDNFAKIPGSPVAYWAGESVFRLFSENKLIDDIYFPRQGLATGDNEKFLRLWFEVKRNDIGISHNNINEFFDSKNKYIPYNKGGSFQRWYFKQEWVIRFDYPSYCNLQTVGNHLPSKEFYFKESITWSKVTSGSFSMRYVPIGSAFDVAGCSIFSKGADLMYLLGFTNSVVMQFLMNVLSQTLNYEVGTVKSMPLIHDIALADSILRLVCNNKTFVKNDYDSTETSWDFVCHPLVCGERTVAAAFDKWKHKAAERFEKLKANEEEINRIFIDIYGLQDELAPEVEDKDVTVRRADLGREVRSFVSYAVGCMFGRYSLDAEGLVYGGGHWDAGKYRTFIPDKDNIIPICDDEYFDDDIVGRFVDFVRVVYGAETLDENLKFIAEAIGGKGTPREVIRNYFLNDFYSEHCKIYQKRPIYWLFDSGKKNGFKALIYLHRYSRDLLAKLRTDYVHEQQERYRTQLVHITTALTSATGADRARLLKQQDKLTEQSREIGVYEEKVHHLADQNIMIDLDDGVKKNYEIFTDVLAKI